MAQRSHHSIALLGAFALAATAAACQTWQQTRRDIIDPVNRLVHADYPAALRAGDSARVAALFVPELVEWAVTDSRQIVAMFDRIDRLRCVIHDAAPPDADGQIKTECVLRVDGVSAGRRLTWEQDRVITARPHGAARSAAQQGVSGWRISRVEAGHLSRVEHPTAFTEEARERGLIATNRSRGALNRIGKIQTYLGSGGVAVGDVDGDRDDDLLLLSGDRLRLFRNDGGTFVDITSEAGLVTPPTGECRCGYFADIDNDGDQDLLVAMFAGAVLLFENTGKRWPRFRRVPAAASGLTTAHGQVASACFGDFDSDGDLDLVLACGNDMYRVHPAPEDNGRNGFPDQYYRNNGDGTFTDATAAAGLGETGWALACAASDYDRDGDLDLYIANDVGVDLLYRNRGDGTFEDVTEASGCGFSGSSMSADFGDVNGDGWPDLYISGMASNSRWLLRQPAFPVPLSFPLNVFFRQVALDIMWEMLHGNRLYLNNRDGTFREVSSATRSYWLGWAWSAVFLDYDNDTHLDIYGANGFWSGKDATDC